ncbi:MAG: aromatic ring-hydroxylating dioxygenase subunit alpha [Deltaproteobacteria bacterium]|nr:MAG: aromatic ring-hydroxylating dioxygenase subunit alpha [Deltaproteobacteria bacterium]
MNRLKNSGTQPFKSHRVFNNWDVVAKGWYLVCPSTDVGPMAAKSVDLCGQRLTLFRGEDGRVRAVDAFCPHMGTDLGIGKVVGNSIQCFFHQWRFDGRGACVDIPCTDHRPEAARTHGYATDEKYGFIWVWPEVEAPEGVPEYPELAGQEVVFEAGRPTYYPCHHHVCMINGIDAQHLRTVHNLAVDMQLDIDESSDGRIVDYLMRGQWSDETRRERMLRRLFGAHYAYRMRYVDGTVGLLTTGLEARIGPNGPPVPAFRMIFAFTPLAEGQTRVQPIYVAPKGTRLREQLVSRFQLFGQKRGYYFLKDEDGAIYSNIRFQNGALLPIDKAVAKYISWTNRLPVSRWSTTHQHDA